MVEFVCAVCVYCVELAYCAGSGTVPRRERGPHTCKKAKTGPKLIENTAQVRHFD